MTVNRWSWVVAGLAWLTALIPARYAGWLLTLYATHGGTVSAAFRVALPSLKLIVIYVAAGILYLRVRSLRVVIFLCALVWAVVGVLRMPEYIHHLSTLNYWHNILAEGVWETAGCAAMACAAGIDLLLQRKALR